MRCLECGAEMRWTDEPITEVYRGESFTVDGIGRYVCDQCSNDEMSAAEAEKLARSLAREYAHAHGLLSPDEIREFRKSRGLTQKDLEKIMRVSTPTVSRWETGAMQQSGTADTLIRMLRDHPAVLADAMERAEVHAAAPVDGLAAYQVSGTRNGAEAPKQSDGVSSRSAFRLAADGSDVSVSERKMM